MNKNFQCQICPNYCKIAPGKRGKCGIRYNNGKKLVLLTYGKACAVNVDPIEKKPIYHMMPGSLSFSIATTGCCLECLCCQNWTISQCLPEEAGSYNLPPEAVVQQAIKKGCKSIAYTYTEPTVFYEYMLDTAIIAKSKGLKNIYVTSGYINPEPLKKLTPYIDAANIDLKGFSNDFYKNYCSGTLKPVLDTIKYMSENNTLVEITNLLIPTLNDDMKTIKKMCEWIIKNAGDQTPIHFSRFHPMYKLKNLPPTPPETILNARKIALDTGLKHVYAGNLRVMKEGFTYCPSCGKAVIERFGYTILKNNLTNGKCNFCKSEVKGVW